MQIRQAELDDSERISLLMRQLGYEAFPTLIKHKLLALSGRATDLVLVADDNGMIKGIVSLHEQEMFHQDGRLGRITSLVIDEMPRGEGVGSLLVLEADNFFRRSGCVKAEVTSGGHRPQAHLFYQKPGYAQDERRFLKRYQVANA
ncbi:MAG: GNAT family N-acetyltransferase [Candidimonas sp.]|nr:MAG: GNAT family N-acetyltransferase [Candidimonas sp.]TAM21636.1 MAG: GNAT family N-acetyltransferase [Candidimonas sp.]TAM79958.1 MAG: GNAT family N-acetyltransferase [Candidimonas sp.]